MCVSLSDVILLKLCTRLPLRGATGKTFRRGLGASRDKSSPSLPVRLRKRMESFRIFPGLGADVCVCEV